MTDPNIVRLEKEEGPKAYRFCRRHGRCETDARHIVTEAVGYVQLNYPDRPYHAMRKVFWQRVKTLNCDHVRAIEKQERLAEKLGSVRPPRVDDPAEIVVLRDEQRRKLDEAQRKLDLLTRRERDDFQKVEVAGLPVEEQARATGRKPNAVRNSVFRAKKRIDADRASYLDGLLLFFAGRANEPKWRMAEMLGRFAVGTATAACFAMIPVVVGAAGSGPHAAAPASHAVAAADPALKPPAPSSGSGMTAAPSTGQGSSTTNHGAVVPGRPDGDPPIAGTGTLGSKKTAGVEQGISVSQKHDGKSFTQEVVTCLQNGVEVTMSGAGCKQTPSPSPVPISIIPQ